MAPPTLAVVVIARNEETIIGACLEACLRSIEHARTNGVLELSEIVLVDSASTDRTREIAARSPVRVIRLPRDWPLSAAAGRFVGYRSTRSDFILFVDGDFVLEPTWLARAMDVLGAPDVAAVCGVDRESLERRSRISKYVDELSRRAIPPDAVVETDAVPVGVYRRSWIEQAGGIQPFLRGAEDRDLGMRIREIGGRLLKTRETMGVHHWNPGGDLTLTQYLRSVAWWSFGEGQAARYALRRSPVRTAYVRRYLNARHLIQLWLGVLLAAWTVGIAASLVRGGWFGAAATAAFGAAAIFIVSRRREESISATLFRLHEIPYVTVRLVGFAGGHLWRIRPASEYPSEVMSASGWDE